MRRSLRRASQAAAISAIALLAAGCASVGSSAGPQASPKRTFRSTAAGGSSPASVATHKAKDPRKDPFASLASYIATRPGLVTAAVYDRATGKTWVFHPGIKEHTASIVKVEILGTALKQAQDAGSEPPGAEQVLMRTMIENSDNGAATELLRDVGGPGAVQRFDNSAGMSGTAVSRLA